MITLQEAINIAKSWNDKFDAYQEYEDVYEFFIDDGEITAGGNHECIIDKESGRKIPWALYFMDAERKIVEVGEPVKLENIVLNGDISGKE